MQLGPDYQRNFVFICCCQCMATLGLMAMVPIMPLYLETIGQGYAPYWSSIALAAPAITGILCAKKIGSACDKYGYRFMVIITLVAFSISMFLMALSDSIVGFLVGRLLLGVASLNLTLTAFSVATNLGSRRGQSLGALQSASALGSLLGPTLGGLMMDFWSLPLLLIATASLGVVAALLARWLLNEPAHFSTKDVADPVPDTPASDIVHTLADNNIPPLKKTDPALKYWATAACLSQSAAFALVNIFVLFLAIRIQDLPLATTAGVIHAGAWIATLLFSPWWGRKNDRCSPKRNFCIAAIGCASVIGVLPFVDDLWLIVVLRFLQGAFFSALAQTIFFALTQHESSALSGAGVGLAKQYLLAGQILGPMLVAVLIPWISAVDILYWVSALFLGSALMAFLVDERKQLNASNT